MSRKKTMTALAALGGGAVLLSPLAMPVAYADSISETSVAILQEAALDSRLADDGVTPIAVTDGDNVYGARPTPYPYTADLGAISGTSYFVDCAATEAGTGTQEEPLNSLDAANALELKPGDAVLFKGGSTCTGTFTPHGSGTADAPITLDAYEASAEHRARIDGAGNTDAVLLLDVEHYVVRNLELTNVANDATDYAEDRHGLRVAIGERDGTGYDVANLYVHDVLGKNAKDAAGIRFEINGSKTQAKFSDVEIAYNTLRHVNRTGIVVATNWWQREEAEYWGGKYFPMDPVMIHDNFLTDIGGDGIVVWAAPKSLIDHNTLENAANEHQGKSDNSHNAGIWSWVTDDITFANNHVFGMHRSNDNNDGAAFDADTGGSNQVFEHNLTHDNDGGFIMYCGCWGLSTDITARYNISINDGRFVDMVTSAEATGETARTVFMAGATDSHFYNNTVLLPPTDVNIAGFGHYMVNNIVMANNLYLSQEGTAVSDDTTYAESWGNTVNWRNNVFAGPATGWPTGDRADNSNQIVPNLGLASGKGLAKFHITDAALAGSGYPVADPFGDGNVLDFVGNPVPTVTEPDVGAFQFSPIPAQVTVTNGGFEDCDDDASWSISNGAVSGDTVRSGDYALVLDAQGAASQTVPAAINRTYRLTAAVSGEKLPTVSVTLPSGATVVAEPQLADNGVPVVDEKGYTPVELVFRTAFDATTFDILVDAPQGGIVDDVVVTGIADHVVDGTFEAITNTVWQPPVAIQGTPGNSGESGPLARSTDAVTGDLATPVPATGKRLNANWAPEEFTGDAFNRFTYVTPDTEYELSVWAKADEGKTVSLVWDYYPGWAANYPLTIENPQSKATTDSTSYSRISTPVFVPYRENQVYPAETQISVACQGNGLCDDMTLVEAWDGTAPAIASAQCTTDVEPDNPAGPESTVEPDNPGGPEGTAEPEPGSTGDPSGELGTDEPENQVTADEPSDQHLLADNTLATTGASVGGLIILSVLAIVGGVIVRRRSA